MTESGEGQVPGFTVEAAHARDQEKEVTYPPRPPREAPDFAALRRRVLQATETARGELGDD
jgi:hypothetical protein